MTQRMSKDGWMIRWKLECEICDMPAPCGPVYALGVGSLLIYLFIFRSCYYLFYVFHVCFCLRCK